jgi:hypothetical protein
MKKLLALVLALVMTLGLATVGTNAANWSDLKDTDKVAADREEAFQVLNAIQVIEGDNEGNLNPDKQLTRAEAAAIIARLNLGKTTAESLTGVGSKFTDVPANFWDGKGAGYIEYCASTGIIAGRGDGTFDPNGDLTVAAFAKMLLVSLGYNAETEKFLGPDWQINVMSLANRAGLFAGASNPVATDKVTRADAAQFAFNTLKTPLVTYGWSGSNMVPAGFAVGQTSAIYDTTNARDTQTISRALANDGTARGTYLVEFAERHFPALVRDSHDVDEWGNPCTTWTYNRNKIDSYKNTTMRVMSETEAVTSEDVYKAIGAELLVRMANNVAGEDFIFNVYIDGVNQNAATTAQIRNEILRNNDTELSVDDLGPATSGAGTLFEVFVDDQSYWDDGYSNKITAITLVTTHTWLAEVTADMNNNGLRLNVYMRDVADNGGTAMKASDKVVPEDMTAFKEGEKVLVQMTDPDNASNKRTVRHVLPAELASDTYVSGYTANRAGTKMVSIRVDEKDNTLAEKAHTNSDILRNYNLQQLRNFTYDVWKDQYGNVIGIEYNKTGTSYVFVTGFEFTSSYLTATTCKANVIWMDGKMETISLGLTDNGTARTYLQAVAAASDPANQKGCATVNTWFSYSKADNGAVVLDNACGYLVGGTNKTNAVNQASLNLVAAGNNIEISAADPTLQYKNGGYAFGNDKTVYITVEAKSQQDCAIAGGAIAKVNGVVTGVKNARIDTTNIQALDTTASNYSGFAANFQGTGKTATNGLQNLAQNYANTYFLYNGDTGYVLAAVVVSESKGGDVVYIISQARRDYIAGVGYVDTYNAIVNGEVTKITVDCTSTGTNDTKLNPNTLYIMRKGEEHYVWYGNTAVHTLDTNSNGKAGYAVALSLNTTTKTVTLKENTLWITNNNQNEGYILTNGKTVYFVNQNGGTSWTKFTSAGAALAAGNVDGKTYIQNVYADCEGSTGVATTVVFQVAAIGTGTGVVAAGTAATAKGTANAGTYKASAANIYDVRVGKNGSMTARIDYTAPLYVAKNANVTFDVEVYDSNGKWIQTLTPGTGMPAGTYALTDGKTDKIALTGSANLYEDANLTFKVVNETANAVNVRFIDADGNLLTSALTTKADATTDIITSHTTIAAAGIADGSLKADASTGKYSAGAAIASVTGLKAAGAGATVSKTGPVATVAPGAAATAVVANTSDASNLVPTGDDYVTVTLGAALTDKTTYSIIVDNTTGKDLRTTGVALSEFGVGTDYDAAAKLTVAVTAAAANKAKNHTYDVTDMTITITEAAGGALAFTKAYGYIVSVKGFGTTTVIAKDETATALAGGTFTITGDKVITVDDITVTPIAKLDVVAAETKWDAHSVTIVFNEDVVTESGTPLVASNAALLAKYTWNAGGKGNTAVKYEVEVVNSKTIKLTFTGDALVAGNTITLTSAATADIKGADTDGTNENYLVNKTITLAADGKVTVSA